MFQGFLGIFSKKPLWGGAGGTVGSRRFDSNTHQIVPSSIGCWKMDFRIFHPAESLRLNGASPCYFGNEIFLMPQHCLANSGFFFARVRKKHFPTSWNVNASFVGMTFLLFLQRHIPTHHQLWPQMHVNILILPHFNLRVTDRTCSKTRFFLAIFLHAN